MSGGREFRIGVTADDSGVKPALDKLDKALQRFEQGPGKRLNTQLDQATRKDRLDQWEKGWAKVGTEVRGIGDSLFNMLPGLGMMTKIGTAGAAVAAGGATIYSAATQGRSLEQASVLLGMSVDRLNILIGAAGQKGIDQATLINALFDLQMTIHNARLGFNTDAMAAFGQLRIRLPTKDQPIELDKLVPQIAAAISRQTDAATRVDVAQRTSTMPLFQMLVGGAEGLKRLQDTIPPIANMSEGAAKKMSTLRDSIDRLGAAAQGAANRIGTDLAEKLNAKGGVDYLTDFFNMYATWPGFSDKLRYLSKPAGTPTLPGPPAANAPAADSSWSRQPRITDYSSDDMRAAGRARGPVSVSGPDGSVIIKLRVDADPSLRVRATAQDEGRARTEIFMPTDGP